MTVLHYVLTVKIIIGVLNRVDLQLSVLTQTLFLYFLLKVEAPHTLTSRSSHHTSNFSAVLTKIQSAVGLSRKSYAMLLSVQHPTIAINISPTGEKPFDHQMFKKFVVSFNQ